LVRLAKLTAVGFSLLAMACGKRALPREDPSETARLNLASLEPAVFDWARALERRDLPVHWADSPPRAFGMRGGRYLVEEVERDGRAPHVYVYDAKARRLSDLGAGRTAVVPRHGRLIVDGLDCYDVDPKTFGRRKLWSAQSPNSDALVGEEDGAPVFAFPTPNTESMTESMTFVRIESANEIRTRTMRFPRTLQIANKDAIRGSRVLVVDTSGVRPSDPFMAVQERRAFVVPVATVDLGSWNVTQVGEAFGQGHEMTGTILPYYDVRWDDDDFHVPGQARSGECVNFVDPKKLGMTDEGCEWGL
jgi:hypothetical protein